MASELKLQRLTETGDTFQVTEILVAPGQQVEKDQPLIVVNADKSTMEIPAPMAGTIVQLKVKAGEEVKVGAVYAVIEGANGSGTTAVPAPAAPATARAGAPEAKKPDARDDDHVEEPTPHEVKAIRAAASPTPPPPRLDVPPGIVAASPATRWLARKLGVDLAKVHPTGPNNRILEEDVKSALAGSTPVVGAGLQLPPLPAFEKFGEVVREPLSHVRKLTAQKMATAWAVIPHVTQHDLADVTDLETFRKQQDARFAKQEGKDGKPVKLTVLAFVLKACAVALRQFPTFNSTLDLGNNQLVLKKYYHIGVAVDTKGGLLVPVVRDVDKKSIEQLARELAETGEKARSGKADMAGGSFTITNLGGIGGTAFTPIVNYPEVAILGLSRGRTEPVWRDGAWVPRLMLPLSLSYDHRVIDGADAARFTRRVAELLENPWMMVMHA
jgi:pyruvate dehydrogenase E2 component (dihydrolipoamide acetyltransferase)